MVQSETKIADDARDRLIETARAMVLRGDNQFSVGALCREAGVARAAFRAHFAGHTALMAAVMQDEAPVTALEAAIVAAPSVPLLEQIPKVEQGPAVSTPDAWLERRLRVFERALTSLEAKAEATSREQARVIAQLEEKLLALGGEPVERRLASRPVEPAMVAPALKADSTPAPIVEAAAPEAPADEKKPAGEMLAIAPLPVGTFSKEEMADVLQVARDKARAAAQAASARDRKPGRDISRVRWLAIAALSLVALFVCIGLTLGNTAHATQNGMAQWQGAGISHRHAVQGALAQTIASADFGDAKAEARLALAYLRGQGVARDAGAALRWSAAAAQAGQPVAQYLMGALYSQGEAVTADPARAFAWFAAAAAHGNLKAMHNLAIAYAEGHGTAKDEASAAKWFQAAAERGYVDSAFDLAVMYERGAGVVQDPRQALKWYGIAAAAGDQPSKARAEFLRGQLTAADAKLATDAALAFAPLPALPSANIL
jgi:localization factor PodJL